MDIYDVTVIGGGVVGCAILRELSKYNLRCLLLEKHCDVGMETSARNSGVAHAGFYVPNGTLKAKLNVEGHRMLPKLCRELDVPYLPIGKLVVAKEKSEIGYLEKLKATGDANGSRELSIIGREEVKSLEPGINACAALYSPTSAILDPFELTLGLAENAVSNGAEIRLLSEVTSIMPDGDFFRLTAGGKEYCSRVVINSAGLCSDRVAGMIGNISYKIYPCRGEYHILDKEKSNIINHLVYPVPPADVGGLGVHLTPTVHGNVMLGPSAEYIEEPSVSTTRGVMDLLSAEAREIHPEIHQRYFIRSFAGVRPKLVEPGSTTPVDFVIEKDPNFSSFINLIGIESPGLTSAPAIAEMVLGMVSEEITLEKKESFNPVRKGIKRFMDLPDDEKNRLILEKPAYGQIVCRCEKITAQEIMDALGSPLKVCSIDAIKRRCRAGAGRCQGGFCMPRIVEIMEEVCGCSYAELRLKCPGSELFVGTTKQLRKNG